MVKEKLIIKNFAGFEHIEFDFKPINIFIGPQAAGKSIVIKLAYYFKSLISNIYNVGLLGYTTESFIESEEKNFKEYFPESSWGTKKFGIEYITENEYVKVELINNKLKLSISENILSVIRENFDLTPNLLQIKDYNLNKKFSNYFSLNSHFDQFFIPAGRSFFSNIQSNVFSLFKNNLSLDPFLVEFGSFYEKLKIDFNTADTSNSKISHILKAKYKRELNQDYLIHLDERKVNIVNASSGQQEVLPLLLLLQTFKVKHTLGTSAYIEEPEAHLYPDAQKQIVQLLAQVFNSGKFQLFITTHSPYILAAFNNLIEAGNIIKEKPYLAEKVYNIIPREEVLQLKDLVAYSIKDGKKAVLIDEENNLISQNILDDISNEIAEEFGKLLDLE